MAVKEILEDIISGFEPEKFVHFFREKNKTFKELDIQIEIKTDTGFSLGKKLGEIELQNGNKLIICTFRGGKELKERSGKKAQYLIGKKVLKDLGAYAAGIFIFYDTTGRFRFSLIYDIPRPSAKRDWSNFRRYTYYVSPEFTNKTFIKRMSEAVFDTLENIIEAFSVEKVTKEFYQEIANWYFWALKKTEFPKDAEAEPNGKNIAVIRLITRLIFIWFMREKGLIVKSIFDKNFVIKILKDLSGNTGTYYNAILQNLFFATLNTPIKERKFRREEEYKEHLNKDYMDHKYYRFHRLFRDPECLKELFGDIPFLNGGLFECLDKRKDDPSNETGSEIRIDGFSDKEKNQPIIPNELFFAEEKEVNLNKEYGTVNKKFKVRGILNTLNSYNFTIDENTEDDEEVALDPELLGKVFENLLASYNPETATTARNATGSFYTPRKIVNFMVEQSLKEYLSDLLKDHIPDLENKIEFLFSVSAEKNPFSEKETNLLINGINKIKVLDPAVGSGAYPMGVLHKLVFILGKLDPHNIKWKNIQIEAAEKNISDPNLRSSIVKKIEENFNNNELDYGRKLYLIQNCLYGVDIQPIAIQIAKLRFFISLLVDEKVNRREENFGIEPLPNLETKLVAADTLISLQKSEDKDLISDDFITLEKKLFDERIKYFTESDVKKKNRIKEKDRNIRKELRLLIERNIKSRNEELKKEIKELQRQKEELKLNQKNEIRYEEIINLFGEKEKIKIDPSAEKIKKITSKINDKEFKINQNENYYKYAGLISSWDPFNISVFSEWFDPEWMFGINDGFDVVIGNPPYIQLQKDGGRLAVKYQNSGYKTFERTGDIYALFYERGMGLLKNSGHLCYITSNKWMRAGYGESLREYFIKNNPKLIVDLGPGVFEHVTVDTNIIILQKSKNKNVTYGVTLKPDAEKTGLNDYINKHKALLPKLSSDSWFIGTVAEQNLKRKIERIGKPLKDWDINIYRGILTGLNEAFIIDTETKKRLCKEDPKSAEILKPILRGRDIKRYGYEWAGLWLIATGYDLNIPKLYPAVFKYLKQFEKEAKKRDDQGENWWNLRACAYYSEFEKEKVVWQDINQECTFSYAPPKTFVNNTSYIMTNFRPFILGCLNSKIINWYFPTIATTLGDAFRFIYQHIIKIPILEVSSKNEKIVNEIEKLVSSIITAKQTDVKADTNKYEKKIDELVYKLYELTEEEIKIVEGS